MSSILDKALNELASVQLTDNTIAEAGEAYLKILNILYDMDKEYSVELAAMWEVIEAARVIVPDMYRMCELVGMDVDERKHTEQLAAAFAKLDGLK